MLEQLESPNEKSELAGLLEYMENSPAAIEKEFAKGEKDWIDCFEGRVDGIRDGLRNQEVERMLTEKYGDPEISEGINLKIGKIKDYLLVLRREYGTKDKLLPETVKQELLETINTLFEL